MTDIQLNQVCTACNGTGIRHYNVTPGGELLEENPCSECGGDGRMPAPFSIESEWFDTVTEELDYIHGKVTAIWNAVKPP